MVRIHAGQLPFYVDLVGSGAWIVAETLELIVSVSGSQEFFSTNPKL